VKRVHGSGGDFVEEIDFVWDGVPKGELGLVVVETFGDFRRVAYDADGR